MSNVIQKADQIAYRVFTKLTLLVNQARSTYDPPVLLPSGSGSGSGSRKVDKWVCGMYNFCGPGSQKLIVVGSST